MFGTLQVLAIAAMALATLAPSLPMFYALGAGPILLVTCGSSTGSGDICAAVGRHVGWDSRQQPPARINSVVIFMARTEI